MQRIRQRSGQIMIFFVMVVVVITFFVLWNFDLHKILRVKSIAQNAGDASALMAARWQGMTLNLIGDLNLMQALALSAGNTEAGVAINDAQARLAFTGPMIALQASQQAAKNNGVFVNAEFTEFMADHARAVREDYTAPVGPGGEMLFPEPWPGAWEEYADMLDLVAADGVAAGPDNMRLYSDSTGGHTLLDPGFYEAIAGRTWCWFYHNAPDLLESYSNFFPVWWDPLPEPPVTIVHNSEFYTLGLMPYTTTLDALGFDLQDLDARAQARELPGNMTETGLVASAVWYVYNPQSWSDWTVMAADGPANFPITGTLRPQYNYVGADAVVRVETTVERLTPGAQNAGTTNTITWTAAAKPFGYLEGDSRPDSQSIVLPAFHDVRLIPVDSSTMPAGGGYNIGWRNHIEEHLPLYMEQGPANLPNCFYCNQLSQWENPALRAEGVAWLQLYSNQCTATGGPGGGGPGGGTRTGH